MKEFSDEKWTLEIRAENKGFVFNLREVWGARNLIYLFVRRDFVTLYKQTILGPIWFLIQPLMTTIVFTVVFGKIANIPTDGIPPFLFYMSGIILWTYFSACIEKNSSIFVANQSIFSKVYFPRLTVPIAVAITNLFSFSIQFITFIAFLIYYTYQGVGVQTSWWALIVMPFLILQCAILGMGVGLLISALTVKYRDLVFIVGFGIQLWMYASPVVYPLSQASSKLQLILSFNPITGVIELFRLGFMGVGTINWLSIVIGLFSTIAIFSMGLYLFSRAEKSFIDTV